MWGSGHRPTPPPRPAVRTQKTRYVSTFILKHAASTPTSLQGTSGVWECTTSLQSDTPPPRAGPPGWVGLHPTPCRGAPKPTLLQRPQRPGAQGSAQAARGTTRTQAGTCSSPRPLPPPCWPASRVLAATAEASPSVSGQPAPAVVSRGCSGSRRHPLSKPAVAVGTPTCCPGGPAGLEGRPLQDSCPRG